MKPKFSSFAEWIEWPYHFEEWKRKMCACGDLQCHGLLRCHNCGTEFKKFETITIREIVLRKMLYKKNALEWFEAFYRSELEKLGIKAEWGKYFGKV